jgi:hypothetical protein
VAGFDFEFSCRPEEEELQRQFLRWMQRSSRELELDFTYRKTKGGFYVALNGSLPAMQALPISCYSELDAIVAVATEPLDRPRRRRILRRVLDAFEESLDHMVDSIREVGEMQEAEGWKVIPRSIDFDPGSKTHLQDSLQSFRMALIRSYTREITARSLLEEAHTALEHVMDALLTRAEKKNLSFEGKLDRIAGMGIFELPGKEDSGEALVEVLKGLKDLRRDVKHKAQSVSQEMAEILADAAVSAIHLMLGQIRRQDREKTVEGAAASR